LPAQLDKRWPGVRFDIIIDDGLHTPAANRKVLLNLWPRLKSGGLYYIEDVYPLHKFEPADWEHPHLRRTPQDYTLDKMHELLSVLEDKNMTEFDLRLNTGEADSFLFRLQAP
jgi:hypothetical protein